MMETLQTIAGFGQNGALVGFIVFLRVGAVIALVPAFGERSVPQRIRLVAALMFTVIVTPIVFTTLAPFAQAPHFPPALIATEIISGLSLGIALRLFVLALQTAGSIAAQSTSLSQIFGGGKVDPQPAIGHLLVFGGLAIAVMNGLHIQIARAIIYSYRVLPAGQFPAARILTDWGIAQIAHAFTMGFTLAAPFVIASVIYNVALGVINRAMPQLMVAFIGAPAITAGGLALMFLVVPILLTVWSHDLIAFLANPFGAGK